MLTARDIYEAAQNGVEGPALEALLEEYRRQRESRDTEPKIRLEESGPWSLL